MTVLRMRSCIVCLLKIHTEAGLKQISPGYAGFSGMRFYALRDATAYTLWNADRLY